MSRLILGGLKLRGLIRRWSMHPIFSTPCLFKLRLPWVLPSLLMMIGCIFFWIYISWRLVEVSFKHDDCTKSPLWFWKFITLSRGSVLSTYPTNFDFHDSHLFAIRKVSRIVNHHMLRAYYLLSEKLTFTPKLRENPLNKTCGNWA